MLANLILVATVLVSGVVAQLPANSSLLCSFTSTQLVPLLPACAQSCQQLAFKSSPFCTYDDLQCHCKHTGAISNVIDPCLQNSSNCTSVDTGYIYNHLTHPLCTYLNTTTSADKAACSAVAPAPAPAPASSCNVCAAVVTVTVTAGLVPSPVPTPLPATSSPVVIVTSAPSFTPVYPVVPYNGSATTSSSGNMTMFTGGATARGPATLSAALAAAVGMAASMLLL